MLFALRFRSKYQSSRGGRMPCARPKGRKLALEPLEDRRLLSIDIVWHNRGVTSEEPFPIPEYSGTDLEPDDADTPDNFNFVFGSQAGTARNVVDAALQAWEKVITNFNDSNNQDNIYTVTIVMDTTSNDGGAHARTPGAGDPSNGKPDEGAIIIDANQGEAGWFLDPTPDESSEFMGDLINAFCSEAQAGSPAVGLGDLFSVVAHEMAHLLGMSRDEDFLWEDMADDNNDPAIQQSSKPDAAWDGDLWVYDDGGVEALFTSHNANEGNSGFPLHIASPHVDNWVQSGGTTYYGARDLGNARYANGRRCLPSLLLSRYLSEVYGYSLPSYQYFPNMHMQLDSVNGNLVVRGGGVGEGIYPAPFPNTGNSDDVITISSQGSDLVVEVDIGTDVPGTGVSTSFTQRFPISHIQSIDVFGYDGVNLSGGNDLITLDFSNTNWYPTGGITVDGGNGTNELVIVGLPGTGHSYDVTGVDVTIGGTLIPLAYQNIEELTVTAEPSSSDNTMNVSGTGDLTRLVLAGGNGSLPDTIRVDDADAALTDLKIEGGGGSDLIQIEKSGSNALLKVDAGAGQDLVILGMNSGTVDNFAITKLHQIDGGGSGQDVLLVQDFNEPYGKSYGFDVGFPPNYPAGEGVISRNGVHFFQHRGMSLVTLEAGTGNDNFDIAGTPVESRLSVMANDGDDDFFVGSNSTFPNADKIHSRIALQGGLGTNTVIVDDRGDGTGDSVTVTETTIGAGSNDNFFGYKGELEYHELADLTIYTTGGHDVILVQSIAKATETDIYAGRGNDRITVAGPPEPDNGGGNENGNGKGKGKGKEGGKGRKTWTVDDVNSILTVYGEIGIDRLTVNDTADSTGDHVTVTDSTVGMGASDTFFGPGGGLVYDTVESLRLELGTGHDDVRVKATHPATETAIKAGDGDDNVRVVDDVGTANGIRSLLDIAGQKGHDTVTLEDANEVLPTVVTASHKEVGAGLNDTFFGPGGRVMYVGLEELNILAGVGDDTISIRGTAPGTDTRVRTSDGIDLVTVTYGNSVGIVRSPLTIDGGGGSANVVALIDSVDPTPDQVTVTMSHVGAAPGDNFFGPGGSLQYLNLTQLNLVTGTAGDIIHVQSTHPSTELLLGGGAGNDLFLVDSNGQAGGGTVDGIVSGVTLYGGTGSDTLSLDDSDDLTGNTVSLAPTSPLAGTVGMGPSDNFFGPGGGLEYNELGIVALKTSDTATDTINVAPSLKPWGTIIAIDAQGPTFSDSPPGDRLNVDLTGVGQPRLNILGRGVGEVTSSSHATVQYGGIEMVAGLQGSSFDLVLDMNSTLLPGNDALDDLMRAHIEASDSGERILTLDINGDKTFVGDEGAVNALAVYGSADGDHFSIAETADGLPSFGGTALGSHTNAAFVASGLAPTNVGIHFDGGPGTGVDAFALALIKPHNVSVFQDATPPIKSGVINVEGLLTLSYSSLTPLYFTGAGGSLLIDATLLRTMTTLVYADLGDGVVQIRGDGGFETTIFSGFDRWRVQTPLGVRLVESEARPQGRNGANRIRDMWFEQLASEPDFALSIRDPLINANILQQFLDPRFWE